MHKNSINLVNALEQLILLNLLTTNLNIASLSLAISIFRVYLKDSKDSQLIYFFNTCVISSKVCSGEIPELPVIILANFVIEDIDNNTTKSPSFRHQFHQKLSVVKVSHVFVWGYGFYIIN